MLAVYPGSFDPPTVAHLAIVRSALDHVDELRLVLSEVALGKEDLAPHRVPVEVRHTVLAAVVEDLPRVAVATTRAGLVADIAAEAGADAVVVGTDKWAQILDPSWYGGSHLARDAALRRLPRVLLAPRPDGAAPPADPRAGVPVGLDLDVVVLGLDPAHGPVSSTRARAGEHHLMAPEALASRHWT